MFKVYKKIFYLIKVQCLYSFRFRASSWFEDDNYIVKNECVLNKEVLCDTHDDA